MKREWLAMAALLLAGCGAEADDGADKGQAILAQAAAEARAGWQGGLSAPMVADTLEAEVACTLQWEIWGMAINDGRLTDSAMAALPPEIQVKSAFAIHKGWSEKTLVRQDAAGGHPGPTLEAYQRLKPPVEAAFAAAFTGKPGALEAYVTTLSACRNP